MQENIEKTISLADESLYKAKMGDATAWNAPTKDKDTTIQPVILNSDECQMLWSSR
jgi:hypothetical protein